MSTLALPKNYVEIEQEEMMYLDGGIYLSYSKLVGMTGAVATMGVGEVYAICAGATTVIRTLLCTIPIVGWAVAAAGVWLLRGVPEAIADAILQHKGIDFGIKKTWFGMPYDLDLDVK
jgi:hypothetical protein